MQCSCRRSREGTSSQTAVLDSTFNELFFFFFLYLRKFSVMPMTRGIEIHTLNYSSLIMPLASGGSHPLF